MLIYLICFFISLVVFFMTINSPKKTQINAMMFLMVALGLFVGLGDMLGGYDRYIYGELFDDMADVTRLGGNPWKSYSYEFYASEFGYGTFSAIISYITYNRYIFILVVTLVIYTLLIISLREYAENAPLAVIMFMGLWFFFSFTYLRQVVGCTIVWLSIRYIINRNWKLFLLVWFIAYSFHNSALIFLPMYFVPVRKFSKKTVIFVMIGALAIGLTPLPQTLFATYGELEEQRLNTATYAADAGFRWEYLLEAGFFLYIILTNYRNISDSKKDVTMLNIALVFCAILLVFIKSENGGRLGWMFMIGVICTITKLSIVKKKLTRSGQMMFVVSFLLFFRILNAWAFNLCPYKTFLTPGHTADEWIYQDFEYDSHYDKDKFYRPALWFME